MLPEHQGKVIGINDKVTDKTNINFPSLIRVPAWLEKPLGKYYLYFSAHRGGHVKLAYANDLAGPWTVYKEGTLKFADLQAVIGTTEATNWEHVASPDVHIDNERRELRMYFHATADKWPHGSGVALSNNGIVFRPEPERLGATYFRVFQYDGYYYAIDRHGSVLRSRDGLRDFKQVQPGGAEHLGVTLGTMHHSGVLLDGNVLTLLFSRIGDAPQCIFHSRINLTPNPEKWKVSTPVKVVEPEMEYEGSDLPVTTYRGGSSTTRVRAVRDPFLFKENNKKYLLYAVAGEWAIAIAEYRD